MKLKNKIRPTITLKLSLNKIRLVIELPVINSEAGEEIPTHLLMNRDKSVKRSVGLGRIHPSHCFIS